MVLPFRQGCISWTNNNEHDVMFFCQWVLVIFYWWWTLRFYDTFIESGDLVTGPCCHCNVRAGEIKFVFQHISLPANFLNFNYKFFWIDRFLANSGNKEIIVIKTLKTELAALHLQSNPTQYSVQNIKVVRTSWFELKYNWIKFSML